MKLSESYQQNRPLVQWIGITSIVVMIGVLVLFQFAGRVLSQRKDLKDLSSEVERLQSRYDRLQQVSEDIENNEAVTLVQALPVRNPVLLALAQAKSIANENSLVISEIDASGPSQSPEDETYSADLSYTIEGGLDNVLSFLDEMSASLPIVAIKELNMSAKPASIDQGVISAEITLQVFWAELPAQLPNISESIVTLSEQELLFIDEIAKRRQPVYSQNQVDLETSSSEVGRENPFEYVLFSQDSGEDEIIIIDEDITETEEVN